MDTENNIVDKYRDSGKNDKGKKPHTDSAKNIESGKKYNEKIVKKIDV